MKQSDGTSWTSFLLSPHYRIYRHLLLQLFVLLVSINIFWDTPDEFLATPDRFYAWLVYFLIIDMTIYVSAYVFVPYFLLKSRYLLFIVLSVSIILFSVFLIVFLQGIVFEPTITGRPEPDGDVTASTFTIVMQFIGGISSVMGIGLMIAGVSALLLFRHWMQQEQRINELESATLQSELNFLKSQINPHFLFNMLNNANIMVDEDPEVASHILIKLDDLLRYQFNDSTQDSVLLSADIDFLRDYLGLEKTRRDHFRYNVTVEGDIAGVDVPPLLFIPFVENAVKHNLDSANESYVDIHFAFADNTLEFTCENSKPLHAVKKDAGGLGLANIRRRLDLLFGSDYRLDTEDTETRYRVVLRVNLQHGKITINK